MTAYRQQADQRTVMFCPRCNELLDQIDFGVDICPRCEGFWIGMSVLELSGNQWPGGPQVWWRREVRCPMCATQGRVTVMNARQSHDVIVDQCAAHGVWLDRSELSRVMRDPAVRELTKLREHLAALEPSAEELVLKRERWLGEQEERARLAAIERKRIETERVKREEEEKQTAAQRAEERRLAHEEKLREAERLGEARRADAARIRTARADLERKQAEERIEADRAAIAEAERARRAGEPATPTPIEALRADPTLARARRETERRAKLETLEREKRNHERRIDYLDARIASLEHQLTEAREDRARASADLGAALRRIDDAGDAIE